MLANGSPVATDGRMDIRKAALADRFHVIGRIAVTRLSAWITEFESRLETCEPFHG